MPENLQRCFCRSALWWWDRIADYVLDDETLNDLSARVSDAEMEADEDDRVCLTLSTSDEIALAFDETDEQPTWGQGE